MGSRKPAMQRTNNLRVYAYYAEDELLPEENFSTAAYPFAIN